MNQDVRHALQTGRLIDITTIGRTSGLPRRIETWFFRVGDAFYLSGSPGRRDWYANLLARPEFTFHLKQRVQVDLPARAIPVNDPEIRREIFSRILAELGHPEDIERWLAGSPIVEVCFGDEDES